jgi:DNA-cytosine methyltransferase
MLKIVSLFDGISGTQAALTKLGITDYEYYASEIDKHAITVTQKNYPKTIQLGNVKEITKADLPEDIDLLVAGSPCQGFSYAGKMLNFDDHRSKLFFEFVRLIKEVKPKYFLLENVRMKKEYCDVISEYLGVEYVEINSSLVSAQNRRRFYWANFEIKQPEDMGKTWPGLAAWSRSTRYRDTRTGKKVSAKSEYTESYVEERVRRDGKANTLTTGYGCGALSSMNYIEYPNGSKRILTVEECEVLQTLPIGYTDGISNNQRYKALGNGFTVDVIAHILKGIL